MSDAPARKTEPPPIVVTLVAEQPPAPAPAPTPKVESPPPAPIPPPKKPERRKPPPVPRPLKPAAPRAQEKAPSVPPAQPAPASPAPPAPSAPPAPPPPAPAAPVRTGVSIPASYAASNRKPEQPALSKRYGEQGTVILRVLVKADGTAGAVDVNKSSGYPLLDAAAKAAVETWRFNPASSDGKPVSEWYLVPITFTLRE